jgi:hypothetical protein
MLIEARKLDKEWEDAVMPPGTDKLDWMLRRSIPVPVGRRGSMPVELQCWD